MILMFYKSCKKHEFDFFASLKVKKPKNLHWIFSNLKTLKKHGFKFFQSDKATNTEFNLLQAQKAKKRGFIIF